MRSPKVVVQPLLLGASKNLFSMLTTPTIESSNVGVIILNAGLLHNVGPFKLSVEISNSLGEVGFPSLRIDQSGKGETPARHQTSRRESVLLDFDESISAFRERGIEKVIIIGLCSGADDALLIASKRNNVAGLILLDGYARRTLKYEIGRIGDTLKHLVHWALEKLRIRSADASVDNDIRDWDSDVEMVRSLENQLNCGVRILAIFTPGQDYYGYPGQLAESLSNDASRDNLEEIFFENADHTYSFVMNREALVTSIEDWIGRHFKQNSR